MATTTTTNALRTLRLPPQIFNPTLITRIHTAWLGSLPPKANAPDPETVSRWYGAGRTPAQNRAFDDSLRQQFGEALHALSPGQYPLPEFRGFKEERERAGELCLPLRRLSMLRDKDEGAKARAGLGLVLLLDQFARNVFREREDLPLVYGHFDRIARALVHCMLLPGVQGVLRDGEGEGEEGGQEEEGGELADLRGIPGQAEMAGSVMRRFWFYMPLMHSEDLADHRLLIGEVRRMGEEADQGVEEGGKEYIGRMLGFEERHRVLIERFGRYPHRNVCLGREESEEERAYLEGGGETFSA